MHTVRIFMKCTHVARLKQLTNSSPNTCLTDELAEQRPDMNIKVTPFTVSEKSINTWPRGYKTFSSFSDSK